MTKSNREIAERLVDKWFATTEPRSGGPEIISAIASALDEKDGATDSAFEDGWAACLEHKKRLDQLEAQDEKEQ